MIVWVKSEVMRVAHLRKKILSPLLTRRTNLKAPKIKPRFHFMVPLNDYPCEGLTTSTIDVGPFEILVSNPSSHDDLF